MPVGAKYGDGIGREKGALSPELTDLFKNGCDAACQRGGDAELCCFFAEQGGCKGKKV